MMERGEVKGKDEEGRKVKLKWERKGKENI